MLNVFNPGRVPIVTSGHVVPAGEWAEVPDAGVKRLADAGQLIVEDTPTKAPKGVKAEEV